MTTVISFANHKGGVGKTTLAVSIADALSREGFDVLLIDLDPQGNATRLVYSFDETPSVTIEKNSRQQQSCCQRDRRQDPPGRRSPDRQHAQAFNA
jgi:cellulose biosynthesis protein BcsQ